MICVGMSTVTVYTADTGTVYTGPYPYRRASQRLLYGTVYGTDVVRITRSVIRLYGRTYGIHKRTGKLPDTHVLLSLMSSSGHRTVSYYSFLSSTLFTSTMATQQTFMAKAAT